MTNNSPNVIIIVLDTLRKDYSNVVESELKKWDFISYEKAVVSAPWTLPSHASIFTGLYPTFHGAHETIEGKIHPLSKRHNLLPYIMKSMNYYNVLLTANYLVTPEIGFHGFDYVFECPYVPILLWLRRDEKEILENLKKTRSRYRILLKLLTEKKIGLAGKLVTRYLLDKTHTKKIFDPLYAILKGGYKEKGSKYILKEVENVLPNITNKHLFIFINFMEVHEPYSLKEILVNLHTKKHMLIHGKAKEKDIRQWRKVYPHQVDLVAERLNRLLEIFDEYNIFDNSLIIVTSDHGQLLGEYGGLLYHEAFLYDELLFVPLLIKYPKNLNIRETKYYEEKWIPNTRLKSYVLETVKAYKRKISLSEDKLFNNTAFAESFGILSPWKRICSEYPCKYLMYNKRRIAIYRNNYKLTLNLTDNVIEETKSYDDTQVDEHIIEELKQGIKRYLWIAKKIKRKM